MDHKYSISLALIAVIACFGSCKKVNDTMLGIDPVYIINNFFETWKKRDWKTLYKLVHPSIIQKIKMQKLTPEEQIMSDEELFIHKFKLASIMNPDKVLRSYEVKSITRYKIGDTTVWAEAIVNGKSKKIPITLDGLSLKVDVTRIE